MNTTNLVTKEKWLQTICQEELGFLGRDGATVHRMTHYKNEQSPTKKVQEGRLSNNNLITGVKYN